MFLHGPAPFLPPTHYRFQGSFLGKAQEAFGRPCFWLRKSHGRSWTGGADGAFQSNHASAWASAFLNVPPPTFVAPILQSAKRFLGFAQEAALEA